MNRLLTGCGVVSTAGVIAWSVLSDKHSGDGGTLGNWLTCPQTLSHCKPAPQTSSSSQPVDERIGTRNSQLDLKSPHCDCRVQSAGVQSARVHGGRLEDAINKSKMLIQQVMVEQGVPGAVVAVSLNGRVVWSEGVGLADVENCTPCTTGSVMRIASISKCLTAVALLQLYQRGLVDLDVPIQQYLPDFPPKQYQGQPVQVTVRMLLSHTSGIRHYQKHCSKGDSSVKKEFENAEYYITTHCDSVTEALKMFAQDELVCKPGEYHYTTHGWTLLSAVIEKVCGQAFLHYMRTHVLDPLEMYNTTPELNRKIIPGRVRHYVRRRGSLKNAPYVDLSYKWAGGGYLSNAEDLLKFANAVLVCSQPCSESVAHGNQYLLAPATTALMLTPAVEDVNPKKASSPAAPPIGYGMGWFVRQEKAGLICGRDYPFVFSHTGGAIGASSVLTVIPGGRGQEPPCGGGVSTHSHGAESGQTKPHPHGVAVAVIFNLQEVKGMHKLGVQIAEEFHSY